jgi:O-antigen/teichoic acid export membrane protein
VWVWFRHSRLVRDAGLLMLANVLVTLLALVRLPAITWLLPKEDVGRISVVSAWAAFIVLLSLPGLDAASYHYIAKGKPWALRVVLRARAPLTLLSSLGFLGGALYWYNRGESVLAAFFVLMALVSPLLYTFSPAGGTLGAQERFRSLFWYRIGESLTDFAGFIPLLLGAWWISEGLTFYAFNQIATASMLVLVVRWILRRMGPQPPVAASESRELVVYGRHMSALTAISVAQMQADSLFVGTLLPLTVAADYGIATVAGNQMRVLWNIFLALRYPVFVRLPVLRRQRRMRLEGALALVGFAGVGVVAWFAAALLIPLLLPASYSAAIPYIAWLFASFVVSVPGYMIETYFRTEQDERRQYLLRVSTLLPSLLIPFLMLQQWGLQGILWGRVIASVVYTVAAVAVALWARPGAQSRDLTEMESPA